MSPHAPSSEATLSRAAFLSRARRALIALSPGPAAASARSPSDFDLNPQLAGELLGGVEPKPAAVLLPVIDRGELTVLFTRRTDHLPAHAGQISFPGGKIDETDAGPLATALREAEEEIGLDRSHVEPLGYLDPYRTATGYRIIPVVALIEPRFTLAINAGEVAEAFEAPLSFFAEERNFRTEARMFAGHERRFYSIPYGRHYIWGATAGILKNLHERLFRS
jgi:8-oxo-dGTP pyrophosphatase MutT (NUDIX family)